MQISDFETELDLEDFGGQNQIVNTQEQQREINHGGLSQTDKEESLDRRGEASLETSNEANTAREGTDKEKETGSATDADLDRMPVRKKRELFS